MYWHAHKKKDSTLITKHKLAEWDAPMSQIVSLTTTSALSSTICLSQFGGTLGSIFVETFCGLIPLMVKPQSVWAPVARSPAHPMEDCMSCLARLVPLRRILRVLPLESTPTTPQNSQV